MGSRTGVPRTVRGRATALATAVVALTLVLSGLAAVMLQRSALVSAIDAALNTSIDHLEDVVGTGAVPAVLDVTGGDGILLQVVDDRGRVIGSSRSLAGEGPISDTRPSAGAQTLAREDLLFGDDGFRLLARGISTPAGVVVLYAASSLEPVAEATGALSAILVMGVPLLVGVVGILTWIIIGNAMRPVEDIRTQVAAIDDHQLNRRVPVPTTKDEVALLAETMNEMLGRLEQASIRQRHFVADASHELRSPLAAIRTQLEVALAHPENAVWHEVGADVLNEALRLQRLVDDLLTLARTERSESVAARKPVDLDDLVFAQVRSLSPDSGVEVDTGRVSAGQVVGDRAALDRLVRNLLENSLRHAVGHVAIGLEETPAAVVLTFEDDGSGICPPDRSRVFDRFTRLDEARDRAGGGAGLGLAIAKGVAESHGGSISVDEGPLGGARFVVSLPARL